MVGIPLGGHVPVPSQNTIGVASLGTPPFGVAWIALSAPSASLDSAADASACFEARISCSSAVSARGGSSGATPLTTGSPAAAGVAVARSSINAARLTRSLIGSPSVPFSSRGGHDRTSTESALQEHLSSALDRWTSAI